MLAFPIMLNIVIKRLALAVATLWLVLIALYAGLADAPVNFFGFTLIFGVAPAVTLVGIAWILCWTLGPIGQAGRPQVQRHYDY